MNSDKIKAELKSEIRKYVETIDKLPIKCFQKWKQKETSNCQLCQNKETQLYLFNHCTTALKRYKWRHDSVIQTFMNNLVTIASDTCRLYADINGYECPSTLFKGKRPNETNAKMCWLRPGIITCERNCITVIKVTCPFETNWLKSHDYKITNYQNLRSPLLNPCSHFKLILLEISSIGFTGSSMKTFETYLNGINLDSVRIIKKCQEVAIRASYYIYCRRVCMCLYSSTVKASSDCKMSKTCLRGTDQRSCVVNIYLGASAKFLHLYFRIYLISPPKT